MGKEKIILTGDRPTGRLHIGHYVGSLKRRVDLQDCLLYTSSVKDIHHRIFSPLQTLSVKMWTGAQTGIPYETFNEKRALLSDCLLYTSFLGSIPFTTFFSNLSSPFGLVIKRAGVISL